MKEELNSSADKFKLV